MRDIRSTSTPRTPPSQSGRKWPKCAAPSARASCRSRQAEVLQHGRRRGTPVQLRDVADVPDILHALIGRVECRRREIAHQREEPGTSEELGLGLRGIADIVADRRLLRIGEASENLPEALLAFEV